MTSAFFLQIGEIDDIMHNACWIFILAMSSGVTYDTYEESNFCSEWSFSQFSGNMRKWFGMATYSSIFAWRIPWTEEPVVHGVAKSWTRLKWLSSAFSWQNSISLCPASFRIPRPNLPVTPDVSWLATFAFQSPILKRTSFLGVRSIYTYKYFILEVFPPYLSHLFTRLYLCAWSEVESNFIFSIKIIY